MAINNLTEYGENLSDTSGRLWQFKRDEQNMNNGNSANVTATDSSSFKYKSSLIGKSIVVNNNRNEIIEMIIIFRYVID